MAKQFDQLDDSHRAFIAAQHMFFVASAGPEGRVNVSPKGMDSLRISGPNRIVWRNLTGSGNETAGHLLQINRMTLMWCSFTARPMILRAFGSARTLHPRDDDWPALSALFPPAPGGRQIFDMAVAMVQTSCGYGVPYFDHTGERDTLKKWADARDPTSIRAHWREHNQRTIDGAETGIIAARTATETGP